MSRVSVQTLEEISLQEMCDYAISKGIRGVCAVQIVKKGKEESGIVHYQIVGGKVENTEMLRNYSHVFSNIVVLFQIDRMNPNRTSKIVVDSGVISYGDGFTSFVSFSGGTPSENSEIAEIGNWKIHS